MPLTLIGEAVFARCLSAQKEVNCVIFLIHVSPCILYTDVKRLTLNFVHFVFIEILFIKGLLICKEIIHDKTMQFRDNPFS